MSKWINVCGVAVTQFNLATQDLKYRPYVTVACRAHVRLTSAEQCRQLARFFKKAAEALDRWEELEEGERPPQQEDVDLSRRQRDAAQKEVMGERDRLRAGVREMDTESREEGLVGLFYTLLRDDVVPGRMEQLVRDLEAHPPPYKFSNPHLEAYARELAQRVLADEPPKQSQERLKDVTKYYSHESGDEDEGT